MKQLHLPLKGKWYRMIQSGEKPEEYREITYRWFSRLMWIGEEVESWQMMNSILYDLRHGRVQETMKEHRMKFRFNSGSQGDYTHAHFSLGYPKKDDPDRNMVNEIRDIVIGQGKPEWGAEPGKYYFVIKLKQ